MATWEQKPAPDYSATPPPQQQSPPIQMMNPQPGQYTAGVPVQAQPGQYQQQPIPMQQQQPMYQQAGVPQQQIPQQHQQIPQGIPVPGQAQKPGERIYQNATPLASLGRSPAPVDCPACGSRAMTRITYLTGNTAHAWALGLCCLTWCLCWIPYVIDSFKDVDHHCGQCGVHLATWHKSGQVDVHQHA